MKKTILGFIVTGLLCPGLFAQTMKFNDPILNFGLGSLPLMMNVETRMISPENPTGEKGKGGMAIPDVNNPNLPFSKAAEHLGQRWKVSPFIKPKPGETVTIMDVDGPGTIQHIWMATETSWNGNGRS